MPMQISASLSVDDRKVLARSTEAEPHAAHGMDKGIGLLIVDLASDASDIDVDDIGGRVKMEIPYVLQQHRPRDNPTLIAHQVLENLKFARQQRDLPTPAAHRSRDEIQLEIAGVQQRFLDDGGAAPSQGLD